MGDRLAFVRFEREEDLYAPVKAFLEGQGYEVKAEVRDCDLYRGSIPAGEIRKKRWETRRPITLTANLAPEAELRVEGQIQ